MSKKKKIDMVAAVEDAAIRHDGDGPLPDIDADVFIDMRDYDPPDETVFGAGVFQIIRHGADEDTMKRLAATVLYALLRMISQLSSCPDPTVKPHVANARVLVQHLMLAGIRSE